jgi:SAM-dependent methyltransferase
MGEKDIVQSGYDRIADVYLAARREDAEDVRLVHDLIRRLPQGAEILDAGCGAGVPIARLLRETFQVTGVDFSQAQIDRARRLVPGARFVCRDITELDFPDAAFDAVVSYYAIIHIPREEHLGLLLNFHRMLKPGGLALLCMGAEDLPADEDDFFGAAMYWSHYDAETNLRLVRECSFAILWARRVSDSVAPDGGHLFILAQKPLLNAGADGAQTPT